MANHTGSEGVVKIGANTVAEVRGWSFDSQVTLIPDTILSDTAETHKVGTVSGSGTVDAFWDETDTLGQVAMVDGANVTLNLYPEGATTGDTYWSGTATINQISRRAAQNGMVEASYNFTWNGPYSTLVV